MKRLAKILLVIMLFGCSAAVSHAQMVVTDITATSHLLFKGVPIDGDLEIFKAALVEKGFRPASDPCEMYGTFTGVNCKIHIGTTPNTNLVRSVLVTYDGMSDWKTVKDRYTILYEAMQLKYGVPCVMKREFKQPYKEWDQMEVKAFHNGKAEWLTGFHTRVGDVTLFVKDVNGSYLSIYLMYEDMENTDIQIEELAEEL